ncbi:MAG: hypothetical protein ACW98F_13970 [Candidatus Hodarchaeales archaeon]|jgi:hypothetical protein
MKINFHLEKIAELEGTLKKLDEETDYATIIELSMLISAHYINATMHQLDTLHSRRDIKHNKLGGMLKREKRLGEDSGELAKIMLRYEELRPGLVYGRKTNGKYAREAIIMYQRVKKICRRKLDV